MNWTGVTFHSNLQKMPRGHVVKADISPPLDESFRHLHHVEPTDMPHWHREDNVKLGSNLSQSKRCPIGSIVVNLSVLEKLEQEVEDLRSTVAAITDKAVAQVTMRADHIVDKIRSMINKSGDDIQQGIGAKSRPGAIAVHAHEDTDDAMGVLSGEDVDSDSSDSTLVNENLTLPGEVGQSNGESSCALAGDIKLASQNESTARKQTADNHLEPATSGILINSLPVNLRAKADDRECLSNALRIHCPAIIDTVVFRESELPDELIADNCITEDECCDIRQRPNRRDQVRLLLSAIRGRDYGVLRKFLARIRNANPDISDSIEKTYKANRDQKVRSPLCARCMMKERVNVKYVCDSLMAVHAVGEGLYNEIICDDKPAGAQDGLWNRLFDALNGLKSEYRKLAFDSLAETLKKKSYTYLQVRVKTCAENGDKFKCNCPDKLRAGKRVSNPNDTVSSARSSTTDASRESMDIQHMTKLKEIHHVETHHGVELRLQIGSEQRLLSKHIAEDRRLTRRSQVSNSSDLDVPETIEENKEAEKGSTSSREVPDGAGETRETTEATPPRTTLKPAVNLSFKLPTDYIVHF